jgi:hypothetical protein
MKLSLFFIISLNFANSQSIQVNCNDQDFECMQNYYDNSSGTCTHTNKSFSIPVDLSQYGYDCTIEIMVSYTEINCNGVISAIKTGYNTKSDLSCMELLSREDFYQVFDEITDDMLVGQIASTGSVKQNTPFVLGKKSNCMKRVAFKVDSASCFTLVDIPGGSKLIPFFQPGFYHTVNVPCGKSSSCCFALITFDENGNVNRDETQIINATDATCDFIPVTIDDIKDYTGVCQNSKVKIDEQNTSRECFVLPCSFNFGAMHKTVEKSVGYNLSQRNSFITKLDNNILKVNSMTNPTMLEVFNTNGQKLKLSNDNNVLDISSLSPGLYIVKIHYQNSNETIKFVK